MQRELMRGCIYIIIYIYIYMLNIPQYMLDAILTNVAGQTSLQLKRLKIVPKAGIHRNSFGQLIWKISATLKFLVVAYGSLGQKSMVSHH